MKHTKKVLTAALIAAITLPALNSCKKGEGDPFLSLRSRKARVAGEWTISSQIEETKTVYVDADGESSTENMTIEIDGEDATISSSYSDGSFNYSETGNGDAEATATFEKDGTFSMEVNLTNITISGQTGLSVSMKMERSGTWNFLGGVESDYKKKERIVLNITEEKTTTTSSFSGSTSTQTERFTYANGESSEVWHLTTLKNKEMAIESEINSSGTYNDGTNSDSMTQSGSRSATLIQE